MSTKNSTSEADILKEAQFSQTQLVPMSHVKYRVQQMIPGTKYYYY